jgi:hypothetical protein
MSGDIQAVSSLPSFGKTVLGALGVDDATLAADIRTGTVIRGALA